MIENSVPILGNFLAVIKAFDNSKPQFTTLRLLMNRQFGDKYPPLVLYEACHFPELYFSDPYLLEEIFVTNNKYISKGVHVKKIFNNLMGDSILLSESTELWQNKRKVLSSAFYKDKLLKMIDLSKKVMEDVLLEWNRRFI